MSQTHGSLTLIAQEKPSFQMTRGGGFDTGSRKFRCAATEAYRYLTGIFTRGTSDKSIMDALGADGPRHRYMLVAHADVSEMAGDRADITVSYEGVVTFSKPAEVIFSSSTEEQNAVLSVADNVLYIPSKLDVPVPEVTRVWTTFYGRPSAVATGTAMTPPGITTAETTAVERWWDDLTPNSYTIFEGWVLQNRTMRSPGSLEKSAVWEVTDTFRFTRRIVPIEGA